MINKIEECDVKDYLNSQFPKNVKYGIVYFLSNYSWFIVIRVSIAQLRNNSAKPSH